MITKMLAAGHIARIGRNKYCLAVSMKTYHFPHPEFTTALVDEIIDVHPYLDFRIFDLIQMNEFATIISSYRICK